MVNADVPDVNNPPTQTNAKTCFFKSTISGTYTVDGAKSTGKFHGGTGHGTVKDVFQAYGPKLTNGECNQSNNDGLIVVSGELSPRGSRRAVWRGRQVCPCVPVNWPGSSAALRPSSRTRRPVRGRRVAGGCPMRLVGREVLRVPGQ